MTVNKAKGTAAERAVVGYLQSKGFPYAERRALNGSNDRGDVTGIPGTVIEVKAAARVELAEWLKEATKEKANDRADWAAVWFKKRGTQLPGQWFVLMSGEDFTELLRAALGVDEG